MAKVKSGGVTMVVPEKDVQFYTSLGWKRIEEKAEKAEKPSTPSKPEETGPTK